MLLLWSFVVRKDFMGIVYGVVLFCLFLLCLPYGVTGQCVAFYAFDRYVVYL